MLAAGSLLARLKGCNVQPGARVSWSVKVHQGRAIVLGGGVEVLRNSTLDATSSFDGVSLRIGPGSRVKENVWCACYGGSIEVGKQVLIGRNTVLYGHGGIVVGDWTMIGPNVTIVSSEHVYWADDGTFQAQGFTREPIEIGENVWIGANCVILGGSRIERDVVVGAGAVVTDTLRSGYVYVGVPARPLRPLHAGEREVSVHHLNGQLRG
jgi:acetyltransferase-like isoleucine patch superfamily enzyme